MGDGAVLEISEGDTTPATKAVDREDATMVPVFRLYGYDHYKDRMEQAGIKTVWYGWDPAGHLFGFQERKPPDPNPDKWMTRLRPHSEKALGN